MCGTLSKAFEKSKKIASICFSSDSVFANCFNELCFARSSCSESVLTVGKYVVMCQMVHSNTVDNVLKHFTADGCERNRSVIISF